MNLRLLLPALLAVSSSSFGCSSSSTASSTASGTGDAGGSTTCGNGSAAGWQKDSLPQGAMPRALWGSSATDLYAVGSTLSGLQILHSTGDGNWTPLATPTVDALVTLTAISGSGPTDPFAVGGHATILHGAGDGTWTKQASPDAFQGGLVAAWASGPADVYAVGETGIYHSAGDGQWTAVSVHDIGGSAGMLGVWGSGKDDVYAVGGLGTIQHLHGGSWAKEDAGTAERIHSVWGSGAGDVYAVGGGGQGSNSKGIILRSTGDGTWTSQTTATQDNLLVVHGTGANDIYAVGESGVALHSTGNGVWTALPSFGSDVWGVWATGDKVYAVTALGLSRLASCP